MSSNKRFYCMSCMSTLYLSWLLAGRHASLPWLSAWISWFFPLDLLLFGRHCWVLIDWSCRWLTLASLASTCSCWNHWHLSDWILDRLKIITTAAAFLGCTILINNDHLNIVSDEMTLQLFDRSSLCSYWRIRTPRPIANSHFDFGFGFWWYFIVRLSAITTCKSKEEQWYRE